jgi:hypothetical protein
MVLPNAGHWVTPMTPKASAPSWSNAWADN